MDILIANIFIRNILEISSFHSATGPCRLGSLAAPSDPGCHGLHCGTHHYCYAQLLSRNHQQAPQTKFAAPKLPQSLVHLVDVASLLARRVGCICQPIIAAHVGTCRACADGAGVGWSE